MRSACKSFTALVLREYFQIVQHAANNNKAILLAKM